MATSSKSLQQEEFNEEELNQQIKDVEASTPDEYSRLNKIGGTVGKWMKLIFKDTSSEETKAEWLTDEEYKSLAHDSMMKTWRIINLPDWKTEKKGSEKGDIVESRQTEFGKVYRFTVSQDGVSEKNGGTIECSAKSLYEEIRDNSTMPEWNPTMLKCELIKQVDPSVDIWYQVTAGGGLGFVAPRDFIVLRKNAQLSETGDVVEDNPASYINAISSISVPGYPPAKDMVRAHNKMSCSYLKPGARKEETVFQHLVCCDLKGQLPQFVLDAAFATVILDCIKNLRIFVAKNKAEGKF